MTVSALFHAPAYPDLLSPFTQIQPLETVEWKTYSNAPEAPPFFATRFVCDKSVPQQLYPAITYKEQASIPISATRHVNPRRRSKFQVFASIRRSPSVALLPDAKRSNV